MLKFILCILVLILIFYIEPSIGIIMLLCTILWAFWAKHVGTEESENETGSTAMNTNLEKIVAILDLLMFRVRRLKKPYETKTGMDETTHNIIIKTFDRLLNGISQIR